MASAFSTPVTPLATAAGGRERRNSLNSTKSLREVIRDMEQRGSRPTDKVAWWRCQGLGIRSQVELKDLNFKEMTFRRYGVMRVWKDLSAEEQVEMIKEALSSRSVLIDPDSGYMKMWDVVVVVCLTFTAMFTPYEIAFLTPKKDMLYVVNRLVDFIFVKDMVMQFFLKVKKQTKRGSVWVRNHKKIAQFYLKTWFFIDVLAIVPWDDLTNATADANADGSGGLEQLKIVRMLRVLRLFKLVRIVKSSRVIKRWENRMSLKFSNIHLLRFTVIIMVSCHWFACIWGFFGFLDGSSLICRERLEEMAPGDPRLQDRERAYWIETQEGADPFSPSHWNGRSWLVAWADGKASSSAASPCDVGMVYLASMYWAVMTITSVGYGDILPVTVSEFVVCSMVQMLSSIIWAYIIGAVCAVISNMDPEIAEFEKRLDGFNAMAKDEQLDQSVRQSGREYLREERFHQHFMRNQDAIQNLGHDLRGVIAKTVSAHYLDTIWFFRKTNVHMRKELSERFVPYFYEVRGVVVLPGKLCVVERGAVGRGGRILVPWNYWGDDMLLRDKALRLAKASISLTYTEVVTLSRDDLSTVLVDFPEEVKYFRRAAALIALGRAVKIYQEERASQAERRPETAWVHTLFDSCLEKTAGAKRSRSSQSHNKTKDLHSNAIGDPAPTSVERLDRIVELLERQERLQRSEQETSHMPPEQLEQICFAMEQQISRIEAQRGMPQSAEVKDPLLRGHVTKQNIVMDAPGSLHGHAKKHTVMDAQGGGQQELHRRLDLMSGHLADLARTMSAGVVQLAESGREDGIELHGACISCSATSREFVASNRHVAHASASSKRMMGTLEDEAEAIRRTDPAARLQQEAAARATPFGGYNTSLRSIASSDAPLSRPHGDDFSPSAIPDGEISNFSR